MVANGGRWRGRGRESLGGGGGCISGPVSLRSAFSSRLLACSDPKETGQELNDGSLLTPLSVPFSQRNLLRT